MLPDCELLLPPAPCAACCSQCCEYISVTLPDMQLAVTEQTARSLAAAAAQLRVQVTVLGPGSAAEGAKKPAAAAAGTAGDKAGPPATPAAVASGTLTVQCAGLLAGDTSAVYRWGSLPPAAAVQDPAALGEAAAGAAAAVAAGPKPGQEGCFKWSMQPPTGTLLDWLEAAEVQLQVRGQGATSLTCSKAAVATIWHLHTLAYDAVPTLCCCRRNCSCSSHRQA